MNVRLLQTVGREAPATHAARAFAGRLAHALGGDVLELPELASGGLAALQRALDLQKPQVVLVHLGLADPKLLMLLRERGARFAAFLHDFAPICPTHRLWHRREEACSGPGRTGWKCAWCVSGTASRALELPVRALLYRHRPQSWRTALAGAEALIAPSRFAREIWIEEGAPPERVAVIAPLAAAPPAPLPAKTATTASADAAAARRIVFLHDWDEAYGAALLAAALEQVRKTVRLEVAEATDEVLARWRADLPAHHQLRALGDAVLDADTLVAAPVRYGAPFSMAVAAAQAAGARAVGTAMGGLAEQIVHGVNGFLSAPDDPGALAETLEETFAADWNGEQVAAAAATAAETSLNAVRRLLELIAAGEASPVARLEHGAWLDRRARAQSRAVPETLAEFTVALRRTGWDEVDAEVAMEAQQASRQHKLALNHALAFLRACGCRRVVVMPASSPGAEEAGTLLRTWGLETVAETELPDGVLQLLSEEEAPDQAWLRRRFPQLAGFAGISPAGTETFQYTDD